MTFEQKCGTCKFSRERSEPDHIEGLPDLTWQECHARAPLGPTPDGPSYRVRWAIVDADDWCGEWIRKPVPRDPPPRAVRDPSGPDR